MCCLIKKKCNWCAKRKSDIYVIDIWCKWYGLHICESCYDKKQKGLLSSPLYL